MKTENELFASVFQSSIILSSPLRLRSLSSLQAAWAFGAAQEIESSQLPACGKEQGHEIIAVHCSGASVAVLAKAVQC